MQATATFCEGYLHEEARTLVKEILPTESLIQRKSSWGLVMEYSEPVSAGHSSGSSDLDELFYPAPASSSSDSTPLGFHQLMPPTLSRSPYDFTGSVAGTSQIEQQHTFLHGQQNCVKVSTEDKIHSMMAQTSPYLEIVQPASTSRRHDTTGHRAPATPYRHHSTGCIHYQKPKDQEISLSSSCTSSKTNQLEQQLSLTTFTESIYPEYFDPKTYPKSEISTGAKIEPANTSSASWPSVQPTSSIYLPEQSSYFASENTVSPEVRQFSSYRTNEDYTPITSHNYFYDSLNQPVLTRCSQQESSNQTSQAIQDFETHYSHHSESLRPSPTKRLHEPLSPQTYDNIKSYESVSTGRDNRRDKSFDNQQSFHFHGTASENEPMKFSAICTEPVPTDSSYLPSIQGLTFKQLLDQDHSLPLFEDSLQQVKGISSGIEENSDKASEALDIKVESTLDVGQTSQLFIPNNSSYPELVNPSFGHNPYTHQSPYIPVQSSETVQVTPESVHISMEDPSTHSAPVREGISTAGSAFDLNNIRPRRYSCSVEGCNKTFNRSDELNRHLRVHTGSKPYTCSVCQRTFSRRDHLRTHERTHTGERPYRCRLCSKRFARSDEMKRHEKVHKKSKRSRRKR